MRKLFLGLAAIYFVLTSYAQESNFPAKTGFTGKVTDAAGNPVPYATVALYPAGDTLLLNGTSTGEKGRFFLKAGPGNYDMKISMMSYGDTLLSGLNVKNSIYRIGKVMLYPRSYNMNEVEVRGERAPMELKLDKRVYNIGKDLNNFGKNASDILDNLPSVTVDVEGNIRLRGSGNVLILINGKPSAIVNSGDPQSLRQLQGYSIERIEVITNPSARYDAEGEVGIINIVLKKEEKSGINGSFDVNTGYPHDHGAALNLNYRKNWLNLFISEGISWDRTPGRGMEYQRFSVQGKTMAYRKERTHTRGDLANNLRLGSDLYITPKDVLTLSGNYQYSYGNNSAHIEYEDLDLNDEVIRTIDRKQDEVEIEHEVEFDLDFEKQFDSKDHKWTVSGRYSLSDDTEDAGYTEVNETSGGTLLQRSVNVEDEVKWLLQTDYIHPFSEEGKFEAGARATLRDIVNDFTVEEERTGGWEVLPRFNNTFKYKENIYAAYLQAGEKFGSISLQGGLRAEYSDIKTTLVNTNEENPREYLDWFPSAFFGYEINQDNTLQLSYSRRISRPRFWSLIPFFSFSDSRDIYGGNPNLDPEYTNSFELGYLRYVPGGSLMGSIYYRYRTGVMERITTVDSAGFTRMLPVNLSTENNYGLELTGSYRFDNWWKGNASINFFRAITSGSYEGQRLFSDTYTWTGRLSNRFDIGNLVDAQVNLRYRGPRKTTQGRRKATYVTDLSFAMDVLERKGTITLSVRDLLNSRKRRYIIDEPGYYSEGEFQWRTRQILLSFNYRLNKDKHNGKGSRYER